MIRDQQRQASKVLLDGLYDSDSSISKLLGVHTEVMGEIIWQKMLVRKWRIFPYPAWLMRKGTEGETWSVEKEGTGVMAGNKNL